VWEFDPPLGIKVLPVERAGRWLVEKAYRPQRDLPPDGFDWRGVPFGRIEWMLNADEFFTEGYEPRRGRHTKPLFVKNREDYTPPVCRTCGTREVARWVQVGPWHSPEWLAVDVRCPEDY